MPIYSLLLTDMIICFKTHFIMVILSIDIHVVHFIYPFIFNFVYIGRVVGVWLSYCLDLLSVDNKARPSYMRHWGGGGGELMLPVILPHFSILVLVRIHRVCQTVYVGM